MTDNQQTIVARHDGFFLVSTVFTQFNGWETGVFRCDVTGEVTDWRELQMDCHGGVDEQQAMGAHRRIVREWRAGHKELTDDDDE